MTRSRRALALGVVMALAATILTGCVWAANANGALDKFAAFAKGLDGVTGVTASSSGPTNVANPFSAAATGYATVVLDPQGWQSRIGDVSHRIIGEIGGAKRGGRVTLAITLYAAGNRIDLDYDRTVNDARVALVLDGAKQPGLAYVAVSAAPDADDASTVTVGRRAGTPLAPVVADWASRAASVSKDGRLVVTTQPARPAGQPARDDTTAVPSRDGTTVPSRDGTSAAPPRWRSVGVALTAPLSAAESTWVTELDTSGAVTEFAVEGVRDAAAAAAAPDSLLSSVVATSGLEATVPLERQLRASEGFGSAGAVEFAFGRVRMVSEADDAAPTRALLPGMIADKGLSRIALTEGGVSVSTSAAASVDRLLVAAHALPGGDTVTLEVTPAGKRVTSDFPGVEVQKTPVGLARTLFDPLVTLARAVHLGASYLRDDGAIDVSFGYIGYDRALVHAAVDALAPSAAVAKVNVSLGFSGTSNAKPGDYYYVNFAAAPELTVGDVSARGAKDTTAATADLVQRWNSRVR